MGSVRIGLAEQAHIVPFENRVVLNDSETNPISGSIKSSDNSEAYRGSP